MMLTTSDRAGTTLDDTTIAQFRSALRGDLMAADHAGTRAPGTSGTATSIAGPD